MKIKIVSLKVLIAFFAIFIPAFASAAINVVFDNNASATATPGSMVTLTGSLANTSTSTPAFINSIKSLLVFPLVFGSSSTSSSLYINSTDDASSSLSLLPSNIAPIGQFQGPLVKLNISSSAAAGDYWGAYNLIGGDSASATTTLAAQFFYLHIAGQASSSGLTIGNFSGTQSGLQYPGGGASSMLAFYQSGPRLIQLGIGKTPYWVSAANVKIAMWTDAVFKSYGNKRADIQIVGQDEFDYFPTAKFIRVTGSGKIYKIEGSVKRFIPSAVWNNSNQDASQIIDINKTDFNSYKNGKNLSSVDEL